MTVSVDFSEIDSLIQRLDQWSVDASSQGFPVCLDAPTLGSDLLHSATTQAIQDAEMRRAKVVGWSKDLLVAITKARDDIHEQDQEAEREFNNALAEINESSGEDY